MSTDVASTCAAATCCTLADFTADEIRYLLDLAADLKAAKRQGREQQRLVGKEIALIFEKDSTRTRCAFEVAAYDQGAHVTFIGPSGSHMGHKETVKDTARVLGRMYDAIEYRGFGADHRRGARALGRRAGLQRPDRRVAPDPDPRRLPHDARARRQAARARSRSATSATPASTWPTRYLVGGAKLGHGRPHLRARGRCGRARRSSTGARESRAETGATITLTDDVAEAVRGLRRRCSPTCGSRWASRTRCGPSGSSCSRPTRSTPRRWRRPATPT